MTERLRGAEIFVRALADEGVEFLFGYPGGSVLHIYDEIFKQDKFKHILVRHEQGATHAADGYARATGKPGVVLVTSGPGATNCVTGIATAYMDSIPLVVFTGQVSTALIGNDAFQEVDCIGITRPCVKHNFLVERVEDSVRGRLLVLFPGEFAGNVYRFMDARDGFNYMAVPITSTESFINP